jgi:hypothetical protein
MLKKMLTGKPWSWIGWSHEHFSRKGGRMKKKLLLLLLVVASLPVATAIGDSADPTAELTIHGCRATTGLCDLIGTGFTGN